MSYPVRYRCPRCDTIIAIDRTGYLADRSVTPYPLEGWEYVAPPADFDDDDVDGIRVVCGEEDSGVTAERSGCGEPFYISYVRYHNGEAVSVQPENEFVEINTGSPTPNWPRGP